MYEYIVLFLFCLTQTQGNPKLQSLSRMQTRAIHAIKSERESDKIVRGPATFQPGKNTSDRPIISVRLDSTQWRPSWLHTHVDWPVRHLDQLPIA